MPSAVLSRRPVSKAFGSVLVTTCLSRYARSLSASASQLFLPSSERRRRIEGAPRTTSGRAWRTRTRWGTGAEYHAGLLETKTVVQRQALLSALVRPPGFVCYLTDDAQLRPHYF